MLDQFKAAHIGQHQIQHHTVVLLGFQQFQCFRSRPNGGDFDIGTIVDEVNNAHALNFIIFDDQQIPHTALGELLGSHQGLVQRATLDGLLQVRDCALMEAAQPIFGDGDDMHWNVARCWIVFQPIQHRPTVHHRQLNIQRDRVGLEMPRQRQTRFAVGGNDAFVVLFAGQIQHDTSETHIIVHNQQHPITGFDGIAVVGNILLLQIQFGLRLRNGKGWSCINAALVTGVNRIASVNGRGEVLRQIQGKRAAHSWCARQADFAAQQTGDFAADRKSQTGAAIFAAGCAIGLLKRLENNSLFVGRNPNAGIAHGKRDHSWRTIEHIVFAVPTAGRFGNLEFHFARIGEFERVSQ